MLLDFNYFRYDGDYRDLQLEFTCADGKTTFSAVLPLKAVKYGAGVVCHADGISPQAAAVISVKRGDSYVDYRDTAVDLTAAGGDGRLTLYAVQESGALSAHPVSDMSCAAADGMFDKEWFERLYTYSGELGVKFSDEKTEFRLWSPAASHARVLIYDSGCVGDSDGAIEMEKGVNGTWYAAAESGTLEGKFYTYQVTINGETREAADPYAKAVGVNGVRGQIVDLRQTDPEGWARDKRPGLKNPADAIIYELHVRDLSTHPASGIVNKGRFLGFTERGTVSPDGEKTGLDHIIDLGVTHVHLLPVFDFKTVNETYGSEFNWGYDPQNYNAPEGSYSTDSRNGVTRIKELKQLVKTLHDNGIGVIMDVVYSHVYDAGSHSFERLTPGYYFRMLPDGSFSNGSGCGNETASERPMVRRYTIDSVAYWAREYHIDGFRFDLMGLHDVETMNLIRAALDKIDPSILMYGEGWTGGATTLPEARRAVKVNMPMLDSRIAAFSDDIRDGIKGSVFNRGDRGFINGNPYRGMDIRFGIVGATAHPQVDISKVNLSGGFWAKAPSQAVNYASSHDNLTLWDKLRAADPYADDDELEAMNRLSAAIVLTSQGIPFFQAGEEMARTKHGDENSYRSPDRINWLDWERKRKFSRLYQYYKGLIALRKAYPELRMASGAELRRRLQFLETAGQTVAYTIDSRLLVALNGAGHAVSIDLPDGVWDILADGQNAGVTPLGTVSGVLNAQATSAYVLLKKETSPPADDEKVGKPPLSARLLLAALAVCIIGGILCICACPRRNTIKRKGL